MRSIVFATPVADNDQDFNKKRRLLVIVNPFSGTKAAKKLFTNDVKPILDVAHLSYQVIETTHAGHATEIAKTFKLGEFTEIAACGGDGILNEVLNGLLQRDDWSIAIKTPLMPVPCGTSNAVATAIGGKTPELAAFIIARGFYYPYDAFSAFQKNTRTFGVLSVNWAAIADADHGTEHLRFLGGFRNTVGALKSMLTMKYYDGYLKYLEVPDGVKPQDMKALKKSAFSPILPANSGKQKQQQLQQQQQQLKAPECPALEKFFQKEIQSLGIQNLVSPQQQVVNSPIQQQQQQQANDAQVSLVRKSSGAKLEENLSIKELKEGMFAFVASNVSHLAYDFQLAPNAHISNGYLDLILLRKSKKVSVFQLIAAFADVGEGKHLENHPNLFDELHARAFYLEPISNGSFVSVDGECQKYEAILVETHPGLGNIFCLQ